MLNEQDTNYSWDTNSWIKNSHNKPMWQLWNKPLVASENVTQEFSLLTNHNPINENQMFEMSLPSPQFVSSSPLVLPPPPMRICKNSFGQQQHLLFSVLAHIMVWLFRNGIRRCRSFMRQRKQILRETRLKNLTSTMQSKITSQNIELENRSFIQQDGHEIDTQASVNNSPPLYYDSSLDCDIDDEDEVENNGMAVLQHYIIVWLSIVTSPKGSQLDGWLIVMVIMDIAPLVWCVFMYCRSVFIERSSISLQGSSVSNRRNSNNLTNSSSSLSFTLVEVAEILSITMKKWSPAYQLNEMIMRHVDGCLLGHAAWLYLITFTITQTHTYLVLTLHCRSYAT